VKRRFVLALLMLLPCGRAAAGAFPLDTYAVYDDQSSDPNDIGHLYLYTGNYASTSYQVNSVSLPNTNINTGGVVASGAAIGPYQPAMNIGPFSESYFQISSSNPMNGVIEDPLFIDGNDQDSFINAADTNTYVGTVFMTWMRSCSGCGNNDFGDDLAVINSGATAITAAVREWTGTPPAGSWSAVPLVTSPSIPAGGVWMWSPDTATNGSPLNESGGTTAAEAGNYQVQLSGGSGLCYFGDDFTDYQGSGSNRNDLAHMMPDMNTGREVGTDLVGPNDWHNDGCGTPNDADMIITNQDPVNTANFTIQRLVTNTAGAQWPVSALVPDNNWVNTDVVNQTLAPNASFFWNNDSAAPLRKWSTFFQVISNNGVLLNAWGGAQPLINAFDGGGYMDSADQQAPWGGLFKWGMGNGSGTGASAPEVFYAIAPTNNTSVTFNTTSGTLTTPLSTQTNTSGGPAGLRYVLNDTACPDDYFASATSTQNFYAFVVSQALSNPSGGGEQAYSIPPPNLTQLIVSKTASPSTADVGGTVTYSLVATNYSKSTMTNTRVWDTLPTNLPATFSLSSYSVAGAGGVTETNPSTGYYLWTIGSMAAGQTVTITVNTTVQPGALNGEVVPNYAMGDNSTDQPFTSQNAPVTIVIPGLNLQKLVSPSTASPGDTVTYTLNYLNDCAAPSSPPDLTLTVEANGAFSPPNITNIQYNFNLTNNGSTSVNLNQVQIVYWFNDPGMTSANITPTDYYGGNATPFVAGWSAPTWTAAITGVTPITRPDGLDADLEIAWSTSSAEVLPAGVTDGPIQLDLYLPSPPPYFSITNQYSYQPSTSFVSDIHFAVYYAGQLVAGCAPSNWVTVYDTIPASITYAGSSPSGTVSGGMVSWFDPCIQCQATQEYQWWGTVNAGAGCSISDQADFTSNTIVGVSNLVTVVVPRGTATPTPTATPSATMSSTKTATDTPSVTLSSTPSATLSSSKTATDTESSTPSSTLPGTLTDSPTATPTPTQTLTDTQSQTLTSTPTWSDTPTATATPTNTLTDTQSQTLTSTPTWSDTPTSTATPTQTLTDTESQTLTATPTRSDTPTDSPTDTPSLTLTETATWTATATPTATPSDTATFTASPTCTATSSFTDSPTITQTPVPAPVQLTVTLFNSAGEVVRVLYQGGAQSVPSGLSLSSPLLVEGTSLQLQLGTLLPDGQNSLSWTGLNADGQMVAGGMYTFQTKYSNTFGQVTTYTQSVQVVDASAGQGVNIFNSAGELVWWSALPQTGVGTGAITLSSTRLALAYNPATGKLTNQLVITLQGGASVTWDGLSTQGTPVQSGSYTVQVISGADMGVTTKTLVLLATGQGLPSAAMTVAPNPLRPGQPLTVAYTPYPGCQGVCEVYTLTGRLATLGTDPDGSGTITLNPSGLAPGIYFLEFRQQSSGSVAARSVAKIAVVP